MRWCDIFKYTIDSLTVTLTSETGNLIDMTGGNGGNPELFAVTFIIREKNNKFLIILYNGLLWSFQRENNRKWYNR